MSIFSIVIIIQTFFAIFGLINIVMLVFQRASFYQKILSIASICSFISLIAYLFELLADNLDEALLATHFGYIGKCYVMVFFLIFITKYCDVYLPVGVVWGLMMFNTVILTLVLTCPWHNLYYTSVSFVKDAAIPHLALGKGVAYYIYMAVTLIVMVGFITVGFTTLLKRNGKEKTRLILLCLSGILPAIGMTLNLFAFMKGYDPTPICIAVSFALVCYNVLKYGLLDTMQLASDNVMDYTGQGLVVVGKAGNFVYANPKATQIFSELKSEATAQKLVKMLFDGIDENNIEQRTVNRDDVIYELNYSVLKEHEQADGKNVNGYMAWIFDKTKEYNRTNELVRLRDEAEAANKAKTMFLAKMSHEIRTPMNGIMGFAELAMENSDNGETREYLSYIKDSANALLEIINDILDISKIESGKMEIINVKYNSRRFFENIITIIETQTEAKGLRFEYHIANELPMMLYGDSVRLREIVINILSNAVKYTKKGKVNLSVEVKECNDEDIVLEIHVIDTGIGIKEDKLETIFDSFEQADDIVNYHVEGTGLGLSISRQLTELMGGKITVLSEYGKGSDFCIIIPQKCVLSSDMDSNMVIDVEDNYRLTMNDISALIIDDNSINLLVEKGLMERYGAKTVLAGSGQEALKIISDEHFDVILVDHMMPDMDGVEVMTEIRSGGGLNADVPIILVTANAIVGVRQKMLEMGFDGFVSKPINEKELQKELHRVLPPGKVELVQVENDRALAVDDEQISAQKTFEQILDTSGIDVNEGIKYCGDMESYKEILGIFADSAEDKILRVEQYIKEKDYKNYTILVHSIKSSAANIGAVGLSDMARELEMAGDVMDTNYIETHNDEFLSAYQFIICVLKEKLGIVTENETVHESSEQMTSEKWAEKIARIEYLLGELESDETIEIIKGLIKSDISEEAKTLLGEMAELLDSFDIEDTKVRLDMLKRLENVL